MLADHLSKDLEGSYTQIEFAFSREAVVEHFFIHGKAVAGRPRPKFTAQFNEFPHASMANPGSPVPVIHKFGAYTEFGVATWGHEHGGVGVTEFFRKAHHRSLGYPALIPASSILVPVVNDGARWDLVRISPTADSVLFIGALYVPDQFGHAKSVIPLIRDAGPLMAPHSDWEMLRVGIHPRPDDENFRFINGADKGRLQVAEMPLIRVDRLRVSDEEWLRRFEMLCETTLKRTSS